MNITRFVSHALSLCALAAAPLALGACGNDNPTGALVVPFQIGSGIDCAQRGVEDVKITLYKPGPAGSDELGDEVDAVQVACGEGEAVFTAVRAGTYLVKAEGYDGENIVVVDNGGTVLDDLAEVLEGQETTLSRAIEMTLTPVTLKFAWLFTKPGFTQCTQIPLKTFEIVAREGGGVDRLLTAELACDAAGVDGYVTLPDPGRDVKGDAIDAVQIVPKDATGNVIGAEIDYAFDPPGPGRALSFTFNVECTADGCDLKCSGGECNPD
jgi:hypothetical protein